MARGPVKCPAFEWKKKDEDSLSTRMKMFRGIETEESFNEKSYFEKIIVNNNLKPIAFLEQGLSVSKPVAHITLQSDEMATGFLIASHVLLTNWHVFRTEADAQNAVIRFNYQTDLYGNLLTPDEYECDTQSLFKNDENLDFAVVGIKNDPGLKWGFLKLPTGVSVNEDDKVNIIQHPAGGPKQIAMNDNEVKYVDETIVQYITDTLPGSSGSPVFNDNWQIIALHHSGGYLPVPGTDSMYFRNEGIRIESIIKKLAEQGVRMNYELII